MILCVLWPATTAHKLASLLQRTTLGCDRRHQIELRLELLLMLWMMICIYVQERLLVTVVVAIFYKHCKIVLCWWHIAKVGLLLRA